MINESMVKSYKGKGRKIKGKLVDYIVVFSVIFCLFQFMKIIAYAEELRVAPQLYEFEENNDFMISDAKISDSLVSDVGVLTISGDITSDLMDKKIGHYIVSGDYAQISYHLIGQGSSDERGQWYFIDVKDNKVDGMDLQDKILKGSIIIQTSMTGDEWITRKEYTDVFGANLDSLKELYRINDIQLQNGCYVRIIVAYEQERIVKRKKIGPIYKDEKERRRIAEEYIIFTESQNKGQVTSPDLTPRMIYGKKGEATTAVNIGKNQGYSLSKGASVMSSDDPHYSWALGYFTVNGYTNEVKDEDGNYIFLKNVGDQVTLWFTLTKNIDDLLGDGRLSIAEDSDGEDWDFQITKTNFKRGTLIIRHLDSENGSDKPVVYTDYLAANAIIGANTKVTLFEEGDYEVALDYEIKNEPRKIGPVAIVPEYTNYKLYFKFSIRNGNCMAYPFDNQAGSELRDGDICEDGFTIKLAGSRYNDVTMKYEVVVGEEGQKKFDVRKNMIAKEGATYEDEGVYTFSVMNPYTKVTTTKTVYVGTDPYLKALSRTGRSLSEINDKIQEGYVIEEDGAIVIPQVKEAETATEVSKEHAEVAKEEKHKESEETSEKSGSANEKNCSNELEAGQEEKLVFPLVPVSVGLSLILVSIVALAKNKKRKTDIPKDPEEDMR